MVKIEIKDISVFEFNNSDSFMNELFEHDRVEVIYGGAASTVEPPTSRVCKTLKAAALYLPV